MRTFALALLLLALGLAGFGAWGTGTAAGRAAYDEMAGVVPLLAGIVSPVPALLALLVRYASCRVVPAPSR